MEHKFHEIINSDTLVLVDFYADWCGPCKMMPPVLKEVKEYFGDNLRILKVNVDNNEAVSVQYKIRSIPTLLLFKKGKILWQQSGAMQAYELKKSIQAFITS
jgi:thioredoxin 1